MKYFEDIEIGETTQLGSHEMTEQEILAFGERYDPLPIHTDQEAANASIFGGLIASGWHTGSLFALKMAETFAAEAQLIGGRGIDDLRWHKPVRPGDTLQFEGEVIDKYRSRNHNELGYIDYQVMVTNQDSDLVMSFLGLLIIQSRP